MSPPIVDYIVLTLNGHPGSIGSQLHLKAKFSPLELSLATPSGGFSRYLIHSRVLCLADDTVVYSWQLTEVNVFVHWDSLHFFF